MQFSRHIGIDYSGAETSTSFLPGLRVYMTEGEGSAREVLHPHIPRRHWTRAVVAEWLVERLKEETPSLIGIDHGFSFPVAYFDRHGVPRDWPSFLADFVAHWPTSEEGVYVEEIRKGEVGAGAARMGDSRWRRLTELRAGGAKSVFHFDVQGSVAKSTHCGIAWLHWIREQAGERVHFWPFDGFEIPEGKSAIVEVYPSLFSREFPRDSAMTQDQHDAYAIAMWLQRVDREGSLALHISPALNHESLGIARAEGWILGVPGEESAAAARAPRGLRKSAKALATISPGGRLASAMSYAAVIHGPQKRKGTTIPYISHLMSVSALVMEYGGDEDQAIAGLLHDSLEDIGAEQEEIIRANWGDRVAGIVKDCTDGVADARGRKADWHLRKRAYLAHLKTAAADTLLVSACDKLHNARAIVADLRAGNDVFSLFKAGRDGTQWYYRALLDVFVERLGEEAAVVKELAVAVSELCAA